MGWESRERGTSYYTRTRKVGDRVVREYIGGGLAGQLAAEADRVERERREAEALREKQEWQKLEALASPVLELCEAADTAASRGTGGDAVKALASETAESIKLPAEVKKRLDELRALSEEAEAGEKGARQELNQALLKSSPAVIARASNVGRKSLHLLAGQLAAGNPLTESALSARLDLMRAEIGGPNPSPLESLLVERIVAVWMVAELLEVYLSAQLWTGQDRNHRVPASALKPFISWQEQAHRRLLSAIKTLAQVRKLQSNVPSVHSTSRLTSGGSELRGAESLSNVRSAPAQG